MNYKVCCLGVDVSKATLDIACCVDISKSRFEHIKVDNSASGFQGTLQVDEEANKRLETCSSVYGVHRLICT